MGRPSFNYDSEGNTYVHFFFIINGLFLVAYIVYFITTVLKAAHARSAQEKFVPLKAAREHFYTANRTGFHVYCDRFWILVALVVLFSLIGCGVWESRNAFPVGYDPYAILNISPTATEAEIKKAYKRLTLIHHPDKVESARKAEAEARFIEINKAYKVLTDEETRRLFDETGNADGIRNMTMGIALPAWMVSPSNIAWMLAAYGLAFGILLPYVIGRWWDRSKQYTKTGIQFATMSLFYRQLKETSPLLPQMDGEKSIAEILSLAREFRTELVLVKTMSEADVAQLSELLGSDKLPIAPENNISRRVLVLVLCHLYRIPVPPQLFKGNH